MTPLTIVSEVKPVHEVNTPVPIVVTVLGTVTDPGADTVPPIVIAVMPEQPSKTLLPSAVTELGIASEARAKQR